MSIEIDLQPGTGITLPDVPIDQFLSLRAEVIAARDAALAAESSVRSLAGANDQVSSTAAKHGWSPLRWTGIEPFDTRPAQLPDHTWPVLQDIALGPVVLLNRDGGIYAKDTLRKRADADYMLVVKVRVSNADGNTAIKVQTFHGTPGNAEVIERSYPLTNGIHTIPHYIARKHIAQSERLRFGVVHVGSLSTTPTIELIDIDPMLIIGDALSVTNWLPPGFNPATDDARPHIQAMLDSLPDRKNSGPVIVDGSDTELLVSGPLESGTTRTTWRNWILKATGNTSAWANGTTDSSGTPCQTGLIRMLADNMQFFDVRMDCAFLSNGFEDGPVNWRGGNKSRAHRWQFCRISNFERYAYRYSSEDGGGFRLMNSQGIKFSNRDTPDRHDADKNTGYPLILDANDGNVSGCTFYGGERQILQVKGGTITLTDVHPWQPPAFYTRQISGAAGVPITMPHQIRALDEITFDSTKLSVSRDPVNRLVFTPVVEIDAAAPETVVYRRDPVCIELMGWGSTWVSPYIDGGTVRIHGHSPTFKATQFLPGGAEGPDGTMPALFEIIPTANDQVVNVDNLEAPRHNALRARAIFLPNVNAPNRRLGVPDAVLADFGGRHSKTTMRAGVAGIAAAAALHSDQNTVEHLLIPQGVADADAARSRATGSTSYDLVVKGNATVTANEYGMRPRSYSAGLPAPAAGHAGTQIWDDIEKAAKVWDGTQWTAMGGAASGTEPELRPLGLAEKHNWSPKHWTSHNPGTFSIAPRALPGHTLTLVDDSVHGLTPILGPRQVLLMRDALTRDLGSDCIVTARVEVSGGGGVDDKLRLHLYPYTPGQGGGLNLTRDVPLVDGVHYLSFPVNAEDMAAHTHIRGGLRNLSPMNSVVVVRVLDIGITASPIGLMRFADFLTPADGPNLGDGPDYADAIERVLAIMADKPGSTILDFGGKLWATSRPVHVRSVSATLRNGKLKALPGPAWNDGYWHPSRPIPDSQPIRKGLVRSDKAGTTLSRLDLDCGGVCNGFEDIEAPDTTVEFCSVTNWVNWGIRDAYRSGRGGYIHGCTITKSTDTALLADADLNLGAGLLLQTVGANVNRLKVDGGQWGILQTHGGDLNLRGVTSTAPESWLTRQISGSAPAIVMHHNGEAATLPMLAYTHNGVAVSNATFDPARVSVALDHLNRVVVTPLAPIPTDQPVTVLIRRDQVGIEMRGDNSDFHHASLATKAKLCGGKHRFHASSTIRSSSDVPLDCLLEMVPIWNSDDLSGAVLNISPNNAVVQMAKPMPNVGTPNRAWRVNPGIWQTWAPDFSHTTQARQSSGSTTVERFLSGNDTEAMISFSGLTHPVDEAQAGRVGDDFVARIAGKTAIRAGASGIEIPSARTNALPALGAADRRTIFDSTAKRLKTWDGTRWVESPEIFWGNGLPTVEAKQGALYAQDDSHASGLWVKGGTDWRPVSRPFASSIPFLPFNTQHISNAFSGNPGGTINNAIANRFEISPLILSYSTSVNRIGVYVVTPDANAKVKIVIYDSTSEGRPGALLFESGEIAVTTTGLAYAAENMTLQAGRLYWVGARYSATAGAVRAIPISAAYSLGTNAADAANYTVMRRMLAFATPAPTQFSASVGDLVAGATPVEIGMRVSGGTTPAVVPPSVATPPVLSAPSPTRVGDVVQIERAAFAGTSPTVTGVLTLDGQTVSPNGNSYSTVAVGSLIWTETATNSAGTVQVSTAVLTIEPAIVPDLPPLPLGQTWLTSDEGQYLLTEDGEYLTVPDSDYTGSAPDGALTTATGDHIMDGLGNYITAT